MNLAYYYPIIFWNTANLIVDSGKEYIPIESYEENDNILEEDDEDTQEEDAEDNLEWEEENKTTTSKYGKIAKAIGRMQNAGINVLPPNINTSNYVYTPNVENNTIQYGLSGIVKVGSSLVKEIIKNRPYTGWVDFLNKVKVNKTQMISLIKSGAFDSFGEREKILKEYINLISDTKTRVTFQNANMLINFNLIPDEFDYEIRVFNFNKYLKKFKDKNTGVIQLDENSSPFYIEHFDEDLLIASPDGSLSIDSNVWKKLYDKEMIPLKTYIKENAESLLDVLNDKLTEENRIKYAQGDRNKWSMESVSFYQEKHELEDAKLYLYDIVDFFSLPVEPEIDYSFTTKSGHTVNIFKTYKIAGTVIDKDKNKSQVTLLTTGGVVTVQAYGVMSQYDKQISEIGTDGKKHVTEKSWFTRGNKIIVKGFRRGENTFVAKKYNKDSGHHFMLITDVNSDGTIAIQEERKEMLE